MANPTKKRLELAILGCGFLGTALAHGLLRNPDFTSRWALAACVQRASSLERLHNELGVYETGINLVRGDAADVAGEADVIMLGCQPHDLDSLLSSPNLIAGLRGKLIISLMAGFSTAQVRAALKRNGKEEIAGDAAGWHIARAIPTIAAKSGKSVTLLADSTTLGDGYPAMLDEIFGTLGTCIRVPEPLMNEATALGAACHALCMVAVDAITDAGVADGLDRGTASNLAASCIHGASGLLAGTNAMTVEQLKEAMSTPKGITINAVLNLHKGGAATAIADAVRSAISYTRSMIS